ncbi:hypothetical protein RB653_002864 [Dictyostelium firmibasis]|uniref:t-SNARE coiled-coil homology domain-containing protein n=1 Tax=Dictyostelium firmibasis TaxID=79012 RepID=A0AAN7TY55_9MYCE
MTTRDNTQSFLLMRAKCKNGGIIIKNNKQLDSGYERLEDDNNNNSDNNKNNENDYHSIPLNKIETEININILPQWIQKLNDIDENIKKIISLIEKFKKYLKEDKDKILSEDIEMESRIDCERSIEIITMETIRLFQKTYEMIKNLNKSNNSSQSENKMKKNTQRMKSLRLKSLLIFFKQIQRSYLSLLKKVSNLQRSLSSSFLYKSGEYDINGHYNDHHHVGSGDHHEEDDHDNEEDHDDVMEELNEMATTLMERKRVSQLIKETSHLIQDISLMCVKKDSLFDRIDYNLNDGEELEFANTTIICGDGITHGYYNSKLEKERKKKLSLILIFAVLVIVILFIFIIKYI